MSATQRFLESLNALQNEEANYQENYDSIKQLNALEPESFGIQAMQNFAEIFAPHLISESFGKIFSEGSTVSKVAAKVLKGDAQGALKEATDVVSNKVQSAVQDTVNNVRQQASDLSEAVQSGQSGLGDALGSVANQATNGFSQVTENVTNIAGQVGQSANDAVNTLSRLRFPEGSPLGQVDANPLEAIEPTMQSPFAGVNQGLESLSGAARSQYQDLLTGRGISFSALSNEQQAQALADRASLLGRTGLQDGQSALSTLSRPIDFPGTTSNQIGDLLNSTRINNTLPDLPDLDMVNDFVSSNVQDTAEAIQMGARNLGTQAQGLFSRVFGSRPSIPSPIDDELGDEPLEATGRLLSSIRGGAQGLAQDATGAAQDATGSVGGQLSGAAQDAVNQLQGATQSVSDALSDAVNAAKSGIGNAVKNALPGASEDAVEDIAGGAEGGPEGLLAGGLLAIGSLLMGFLGHHSAPLPPPISLSQPIFTAGLSNA